MGSILIDSKNIDSKKIEEEIRKVLKKQTLKYQAAGHLDNLDFLYNREGPDEPVTTVKVSFSTKNKLKKYSKPKETYEDVIRRLIDAYEQSKEEITSLRDILRSVEEKNKNFIKYLECKFIRENKTVTYHPDLKIEYSYNESKLKSSLEFTFNLTVDAFLLNGKPLSEEDGIKTIQKVDLLRALKKINFTPDLANVIKRKELILENPEESIRTKYLIYFKILFLIINRNLDRKIDDSDYFDIDFWNDLYAKKNLSKTSLREDVMLALNQLKLELHQLKINQERKLWNIQLKK